MPIIDHRRSPITTYHSYHIGDRFQREKMLEGFGVFNIKSRLGEGSEKRSRTHNKSVKESGVRGEAERGMRSSKRVVWGGRDMAWSLHSSSYRSSVLKSSVHPQLFWSVSHWTFVNLCHTSFYFRNELSGIRSVSTYKIIIVTSISPFMNLTLSGRIASSLHRSQADIRSHCPNVNGIGWARYAECAESNQGLPAPCTVQYSTGSHMVNHSDAYLFFLFTDFKVAVI